MLTLDRITQRADAEGVDADVVERDYVLAHVLASLAIHADNQFFQFKGGTSLRLCYFAEYRYSADIDLNVRTYLPAHRANEILREVLEMTRDRVDLPHLELAETGPLRVLFIGPKQNVKPRNIKLNLTNDEISTGEHTRLVLLKRYEDQPETGPLRVYSLAETMAEKLRCVIQRLQCRDLFDIWFLLEHGGVDAGEVRAAFEVKARHRGIDPGQFPDRFEARISEYRRRWLMELRPYLSNVPDFDRVEREVGRHLRRAGYFQ